MTSEAAFLVKLLLQWSWSWSWSWSCRSHILQLFHHNVSWWVALWVALLMKLMNFYPFNIISCETFFWGSSRSYDKGRSHHPLAPMHSAVTTVSAAASAWLPPGQVAVPWISCGTGLSASCGSCGSPRSYCIKDPACIIYDSCQDLWTELFSPD